MTAKRKRKTNVVLPDDLSEDEADSFKFEDEISSDICFTK